MGKIVGNTFFLWLLFCTPFALAKVELSLLDEDGEKTGQVQVGVPFSLEVSITGNAQVDSSPSISGSEQFTTLETGWRYEMINGQTKVKYLQKQVAEKKGAFTVGPASVGKGKAEELSNVIKLEVIDQKPARKTAREGNALLRLSIDKDRVVKGEKITGSLKFYTTGPNRLRNFVEPEMPAIVRKRERPPVRTTEELNGTEYDVITLQWEMYPKQTGEIIIPAFGADYEQEMQRDHVWGGLGRLFGAFTQSKRIYSNALTLHVDELPPSEKKINGLGSFETFTIGVEPGVVKKGEGAVLSLSLHGAFDSDTVSFPQITGLPEQLKSYESKETTEGHDSVTKKFEYIVQGIEPGSFEIPSQTFDYFDTKSRTYKSLQSAPVSITIMPAPVAPVVSAPRQTTANTDNFLPIVKKYWQPIGAATMLPWWLFVLISVVPLFYLLVLMTRRQFAAYRTRHSARARADQACTIAKKQLDKFEHKKEPQFIFATFVGLFADKWQLPLAAINDQLILERLKKQLSQDELDEWRSFFATAAERAYGGKSTEKQITHLFTEAKKWLDIFTQRLS